MFELSIVEADLEEDCTVFLSVCYDYSAPVSSLGQYESRIQQKLSFGRRVCWFARSDASTEKHFIVTGSEC
jgi:hypothetical protein